MYKIKSLDNSIKDFDEKKGIVTGYLSSFDTLDKVGDVVDKKAFNKTLGDKNYKARFLFNHDWNEMIGDFDVLKVDSKGLYYEKNLLKSWEVGGQMIQSETAKKVLIGILESVITKNSFGYSVLDQKSEKSDGVVYNRLLELKLYEGSALSREAANDNAIILDLKDLSNTNNRILDLQNDINQMLKSKMTKEKLFILKMKQLQLNQLLTDFFETKTIAPEKTMQPDTQKDTNNDLKKDYFINLFTNI